ncbi:MAG: CTP synthase [Nitriliruptoraceae bacterium]|jgi:CTP synthase
MSRDHEAKFVFVTGGVASALGKGITAASLGRLLKARGLKVVIQKLDPYINVDPGTMNPFEHGEVFVTEDGGETDLDLGHYERFLDENLHRGSSVSSGQIWQAVINKERRGDYLGKTVQVVPHITNEIKDRVHSVAEDADVVITEVGGTVGDIEGLPFLEAVRQMRSDVGRNRICYIHVALVPYIRAANELKTKPAQHSVRELRNAGIQPDVLVLRSDRELDDSLRRKVSLQTDVEFDAVISAVDSASIYEVPLGMHAEGLDRVVARQLQLPEPDGGALDLSVWRGIVDKVRHIQSSGAAVRIALVGKYIELPDAYLSVVESLKHAGLAHGVDVDIDWVSADELDSENARDRLGRADGILVPGGFGYRGVEGKIEAARVAREHEVPYLGLCLGLQAATIEFARNVVGLQDANSSEFQPGCEHPVIDLMHDQRDVEDMGGTMRLGAYPAKLAEGSKVREAYGEPVIYERHRHRFEFNNRYRKQFEEAGFVCSGVSPDERLVEFVELTDHPFFIATQAHPEFKSRPNRPHPLFDGFIGASMQRRRETSGVLPVEVPDFPDLDETTVAELEQAARVGEA